MGHIVVSGAAATQVPNGLYSLTVYPDAGIQPTFTLLCDDVRLEFGNRLSFMGVFENLLAERLPISLIKLVIVNHWEGTGTGTTEVRVLVPDRSAILLSSNEPTAIELPEGGSTYNVSIFGNVTFTEPGIYWVQTLLDSQVVKESPLMIVDASSGAPGPA